MRYACVTGDAEMMKEVLATPNVDVNEKTGYGETVLFQACYDGEYECAKMLLDAKADVNVITGERHTCLMQAAYWAPDHNRKEDAIKIVKMLLEAGADPMVGDKSDNTAAEFARRRGDVQRSWKCSKRLRPPRRRVDVSWHMNLFGTNT